MMLRPLLIGGAVACLIACTTQPPLSDSGTDPRIKASGLGILHLHCTYTASYCGGAEPDPSEYPRATPWRGRMFIREAHDDSTGMFAMNDLHEPILDTIIMNEEGNGYLELPAGCYLLLDKDRLNDSTYRQLLRDFAKPAMYTQPIDTACMRNWLYGPFGVIKLLAGDTTHEELGLRGYCPWDDTPCVRYNGPLPP